MALLEIKADLTRLVAVLEELVAVGREMVALERGPQIEYRGPPKEETLTYVDDERVVGIEHGAMMEEFQKMNLAEQKDFLRRMGMESER